MSMKVGELVAYLGLDDSEFNRKTDAAGKRFGKLGGALKTAAVGAGAAAFGLLGAIVKTGAAEAMDASAAQAQLEAGIKSTGGAAGVTVDHLNDLASSIQNYSGQTDDSIAKAESLLLTFTNIKNSGTDKIFDQATKATADMAAKMGTDAASSAVLLGKALNDPVKGITALQRVGVSFSDAQRKQIAAMMESGDVAGAQKVILAELSKEFGGAAKAAGDSLPGQLARGRRAFEDMSQNLVGSLMPSLVQLMSLGTKLMQFFDKLPGPVKTATVGILGLGATAGVLSPFISGLKDASGALTPLGKDVSKVYGVLKNGDPFTAAKLAVGKWVTPVKDAATAAASFAKSMAVSTAKLIAHTAATVAAKAAQVAVSVATKAWAAAQWLMNAALSANPIGIVIVAIAALVAGIVIAYKRSATFRAIVQKVWAAVKAAVSVAVKLILSYLRSWWSAMQTVVAVARAMVSGIGSALSRVGSYVARVVGIFTSLPGKIRSALGDLGRLLWNAGRSIISGLIGGIKEKLSALWDEVSGIAGKIKDLKGPVEKDRVLLRPAGRAIIDGLISGIDDQLGALYAKVGGIAPRLTVAGAGPQVGVSPAAPHAAGAAATTAAPVERAVEFHDCIFVDSTRQGVEKLWRAVMAADGPMSVRKARLSAT